MLILTEFQRKSAIFTRITVSFFNLESFQMKVLISLNKLFIIHDVRISSDVTKNNRDIDFLPFVLREYVHLYSAVFLLHDVFTD